MLFDGSNVFLFLLMVVCHSLSLFFFFFLGRNSLSLSSFQLAVRKLLTIMKL